MIPPPVGALAGRSAAGRHRGWGSSWWARQRSRAQYSAGLVGDDDSGGGSGDGEHAAMVAPVMIRA